MRVTGPCSVLMLIGSLLLPGQVQAQAPMRADPDRLLSFAHYLREKGEHYRAEGEYSSFLILFPNHSRAPEAWFFLGRTRQSQNDSPGAIEAFLHAVKARDPRWSGEAALGIGETLMDSGRPQEAAQSLEQLAGDPAWEGIRSRALWLAARAWLAARNWEKARAALGRIGREDPRAEEAALMARRIELEAPSLPRRDPWFAAGLSALLPGAGHLYAGKPLEAVTSLVLNAAFLAGSIWSAKEGCLVSSGILSFLELSWYLGGIESAAEGARRYNREHEERWIRDLGQLPVSNADTSTPGEFKIWLPGWQWRF
jgi:tetratricopeptide (TPR) repeat protein